MKVFLVSAVEPAEHFTRLTTTYAYANHSMTAKTVKEVTFSMISLNFTTIKATNISLLIYYSV